MHTPKIASKNPALWNRLNKILTVFPRKERSAPHDTFQFTLKVDETILFSTEMLTELENRYLPRTNPQDEESKTKMAHAMQLLAPFVPSFMNLGLSEARSISDFLETNTRGLLSKEDTPSTFTQTFQTQDFISKKVFAPILISLKSIPEALDTLQRSKIVTISGSWPVSYFQTPFGSLECSRHIDQLKSLQDMLLSPLIVIHFAWKRALLSLTKICAIHSDPSVFFDNKRLLQALRQSPEKLGSYFFAALRVEPALLQTQFGIETLKNISFWNLENATNLGIALNPRVKKGHFSQHGSGEGDYHGLIKQALLLLAAHEPQVKTLTDHDLISLLTAHHYCNAAMSVDNFRRTREKIFKHRINNRKK